MSEAARIVEAAESRLRPLHRAAAQAWWEANVSATEENEARRVATELALSDALADPELYGAVTAARADGAEGLVRRQLDVLHDAALHRVFLLYPDPWPKARHHRRRFAGPENLAALHRVMAPGAELRLATDIPDYARHALEAVAASPGFALVSVADAPWPGWPGTRYEAKALAAGRRPQYLTFRRA